MNVVVGTSFFFFLVTCSDWPFVDDFFVGTDFFSSITETKSLLYPSFFLNYVWILLLSLLLYSLPSHCSRITSIRSGLCRLVIVSSYIRAQLFLCSLIALLRDSNKIQQFQCFIVHSVLFVLLFAKSVCNKRKTRLLKYPMRTIKI